MVRVSYWVTQMVKHLVKVMGCRLGMRLERHLRSDFEKVKLMSLVTAKGLTMVKKTVISMDLSLGMRSRKDFGLEKLRN
jgi:hypothetical protein